MKVSIITLSIPSRTHMLQNCMDYVAAQDYGNCEHVIITGEGTIGYKRNYGCAIATGDVFLMVDDDDYIAPDFVSKAVKYMQETNCDVTGLSNMYFYQPHSNLWEYEYEGKQPYVCESGMMFKREITQRQKWCCTFPNVNSGEGLQFLANAGVIKPHNFKESFLAFIHEGNTASHMALNGMIPRDTKIAKRILGKHITKY